LAQTQDCKEASSIQGVTPKAFGVISTSTSMAGSRARSAGSAAVTSTLYFDGWKPSFLVTRSVRPIHSRTKCIRQGSSGLSVDFGECNAHSWGNAYHPARADQNSSAAIKFPNALAIH